MNNELITKTTTVAATKRAVIYLRVSSSRQADNDYNSDGLSIPAQREACGRKALTLDAVVVDEYVDRGESARSADRPALQEMLEGPWTPNVPPSRNVKVEEEGSTVHPAQNNRSRQKSRGAAHGRKQGAAAARLRFARKGAKPRRRK